MSKYNMRNVFIPITQSLQLVVLPNNNNLSLTIFQKFKPEYLQIRDEYDETKTTCTIKRSKLNIYTKRIKKRKNLSKHKRLGRK